VHLKKRTDDDSKEALSHPRNGRGGRERGDSTTASTFPRCAGNAGQECGGSALSSPGYVGDAGHGEEL
jgi:hypothetical protein